ncbi:MAG TPA: lysophospholipid acyltransferase family protein [Novosphingobium sp.]|nr:lysophospholipid acyltransferase family protein [Novosphingobium sp.]
MSASSAARASGIARTAARSLAVLVILCASVILYYACKPFVRRNPAPRLFMAGIGRAFGLDIRLAGTPARQDTFFIANHVSWLDIPALTGKTGTAFVAHDGLMGIGWLRWLCSLNDTVFVARHRPGHVSRQVDQVREALSRTGSLAIFPEGTTADGLTLLPFKSSLLSALTPIPEGLRVQPVWLDYGPRSPEMAWVGEETGKDNFLRIAARPRRLALTIHFLPPLEGADLADRKAIAAAARHAIEQAMTAAGRA